MTVTAATMSKAGRLNAMEWPAITGHCDGSSSDATRTPRSGSNTYRRSATTGWRVTNETSSEGDCSLQSNAMSSGPGTNKAQIQFAGTFTAGNVSFDRRVSSEAGYDCLRFLIDGVEQNVQGTCLGVGGTGASGDVAWGGVSVPITSGAHTLTWSYEKDTSVSSGQDAAWIDDVVYAIRHGEEAQREPAREFCERYCTRYTACRSRDTDVRGLLTDPDVLAAVDLYKEAGRLESEAKHMRTEAQIELKGIQGSTGEYTVRWVHVPGGSVAYERQPYQRLSIARVKSNR